MAKLNSFTFSSGFVQGSSSKQRWFPGDPLPWTASIVHGLPCSSDMTSERCQRLRQDFVTRPDDTFIVTFPKSGTTWTLQIVRCLKARGEPESTSTLSDMYPWIDCTDNELDTLSNRASPRTYKSHGTYTMVPKSKEGDKPCKYIRVIRHPKDVCVSLYHHMRAFKIFEYDGPFSEFLDLFLHGMSLLGSWFEYEKDWWSHRHDENVLVLKYEDMRADLEQSVQQIANFMEIETTPEIVQKCARKCQFEQMKQNPQANFSWFDFERKDSSPPFMRKGIVGDWKSHFSEEQSEIFDKVFHEQLDGTGLELEWDL